MRKNFDLKPGHFQEGRKPNVCIVEYNDGTKAAVISGEGVGWTYAGEIEGQKDPTIVSMLGWPGPISQYHAANAHEHWIIRDDADRKGTVQCGAAASVHRDCELLHGIKLGERPLLCRRTPHRDAVHEHKVSLDTRTTIRNGAAAAEYSLHTGFSVVGAASRRPGLFPFFQLSPR